MFSFDGSDFVAASPSSTGSEDEVSPSRAADCADEQRSKRDKSHASTSPRSTSAGSTSHAPSPASNSKSQPHASSGQVAHQHVSQPTAAAAAVASGGGHRKARRVVRKPAGKGSFSERLRLALGMINSPGLVVHEASEHH
jgi:hypothetical protein